MRLRRWNCAGAPAVAAPAELTTVRHTSCRYHCSAYHKQMTAYFMHEHQSASMFVKCTISSPGGRIDPRSTTRWVARSGVRVCAYDAAPQ